MKSPKTQIWNFQTHKYETLNEDDHNSSVATVGDGTLPWHIWSQRSLVLYGPTLHYSITILHSSFVFVLMVQHCFITFFWGIWICIFVPFFCIFVFVFERSAVLDHLRDISKGGSSWVHWLCHCVAATPILIIIISEDWRVF